ncbi:MAG: hypothetical protein L0220_22645 [Acidobacteria bacterium]|nr:hypothetical protein [Acidobacteriota bacterium]
MKLIFQVLSTASNWFASHSHTSTPGNIRPAPFRLATEAVAVLFAPCGPITTEKMIGREIMAKENYGQARDSGLTG